MTTPSKQISTSELDFDTIKTNLIAFLQAQPTISDYAYDGSVMSVLLDTLAYNTHYNSLYTNLAINEMFIDSASKRNSVISLAKLMGYRSKSVTAARALISIVVTPNISDTSTIYTLPKGTMFGTTIGTDTFKFVTLTDVSASRLSTGSTPYVFTNVEIVEGTRTQISYTNGVGATFVIPQRTADISTLQVRVYDNSSSTTFTVWELADSILNPTATSLVYYIKQREDMFYEIYFGNDLFGKSLQTGNVVALEYNLSKGELANKANTFVYLSGANSNYSYNVLTTVIAQGGAPEESIDSIRFNAPRSFTAQHRAVTSDDYIAILYSNFPTIETLNVWGGQDSVPPVYGKVFVAAKPVGRDTFSATEKTNMIQTLLNSRSVVTVIPEFIDPLYLDVELTTNVYYSPRNTTNGASTIAAIVKNTIASYANTLGKFDTVYRHSVMTRMIDSSESSIISNISTIMVKYQLTPYFNSNYNYSVNVGNPISVTGDAVVKTTKFQHVTYAEPCYIQNVGTDLHLYSVATDGTIFDRGVIGSYTASGMITLNSLNIVGMIDPQFEIRFTPYSYDVVPINNYIVRLASEAATVNVIVDSISINAAGSTNHIFSNSR